MFDPAVFGTLFIVVVLIVFVLAVIVANIKIVPQLTPLWWSAWAPSMPAGAPACM